LIARGQIRPIITETLPLSQVADAHRRMEQGRISGRLLLDPSR
jgi:D-arabinose 1-dehydrogenase-like Zn-dependent alcohol dehydrogenase